MYGQQGFGSGGARPNPNNDIEVAPAPADTVSALVWSPTAHHLAASSWDGKVRVWQINPANGQSNPLVELAAPQVAQNLATAILDCSWDNTGAKMFIGCTDNKGYGLDLQTKQVTQVAQHDGPIKIARWITVSGTQCLITGGWDKTIKYWDLRQPTPIAGANLKGKVYCADFLDEIGVVCTSDRSIYVYNLASSPTQEAQLINSPLKYQTRTVSVAPQKNCYGLGSIEGRVAIQYINPSNSGSNFAFKCHRDNSTATTPVHTVNCLTWHHQQGTFATGGSDGAFNFWDKDARSRLKAFEKVPLPITAMNFSKDGTMFAYAQGYDWSRGAEGFNQQAMKPMILIHGVKPEEVQKKPATQGGKR